MSSAAATQKVSNKFFTQSPKGSLNCRKLEIPKLLSKLTKWGSVHSQNIRLSWSGQIGERGFTKRGREAKGKAP